jgi:hypothetical protein
LREIPAGFLSHQRKEKRMTKQEVLGLLESRVDTARKVQEQTKGRLALLELENRDADMTLNEAECALEAMQALYAAEARKAAPKARPDAPTGETPEPGMEGKE